MVGYCSTERPVSDTMPARQMMIDTTVAKIGRSMKNLENMGQSLLYLLPSMIDNFS
jgi:hypothetical protein